MLATPICIETAQTNDKVDKKRQKVLVTNVS